MWSRIEQCGSTVQCVTVYSWDVCPNVLCGYAEFSWLDVVTIAPSAYVQ